MGAVKFLLGTVLLILISTYATANKTVTLAPTNTSVYVQVYTVVNFVCESMGCNFKWTIEGKTLTDPSNQDIEISVTTNNISLCVWSSVLTMKALPINDEKIIVGCIVANISGIELKSVCLKVKGITPVENLKFNFSLIDSSRLTWSPPSFSSENPPILYHIYIVNQHGQLLYNDITEDTSYELYNLTVCDIYTATVIAHSGEYNSSNVTSQDEYNEENNVIISQNHEVIFNEHNNTFNIQFQITIEGYPRLCNSTLVGITRESSLINGTETNHVKKNIILSEDKQLVIVNYTISNIGPQLNYIFIADILDYFNNSKTKNESYFTTYHVQGLTLQYYSDNGSVVVLCSFAERSTADGCHVIFRESSKGTVKSINMSKSSIEESRVYQYISLPVSGNYTVTAHDIVDGTIITNLSVVYPRILEYITPMPPPTETAIMTSNNTSNEWTSNGGYTDTADFTMSTTSTMTAVKPTGEMDEPGSPIIIIIIPIIIIIIIIIIITIIMIPIIIIGARRFCCSQNMGNGNNLKREDSKYEDTKL